MRPHLRLLARVTAGAVSLLLSAPGPILHSPRKGHMALAKITICSADLAVPRRGAVLHMWPPAGDQHRPGGSGGGAS